jgi:hypothetical protein
MKGDDPELLKLLRGLGRCQAQIVAELAKARPISNILQICIRLIERPLPPCSKPDRRKIETAYAAGRVFAQAAARYCHAVL